MVLNRRSRILYKYRVHYELSPQETKIILLLANNKFNSYEEFRTFVYKTNVTNDTIKKKLHEVQAKCNLRMSINNFGARLRDKVGIC